MEDLSLMMESLKILTNKVGGQQNTQKKQSNIKDSKILYNCIGYDSKKYDKQKCFELSEAIHNQLVKYVGKPRIKKIIFYDYEKPILLNNNNNKGEIKIFVEKRLKEQKAKLSMLTSYDERVYANIMDDTYALTKRDNKHLVDLVRENSRGDVLVLITPIIIEVGTT